MVQTTTFLGLMITLATLTGLLPFLRFWVLRNKKRNGFGIASDVFFLMGNAIAFHNPTYLSTSLVKEIKLREEGLPEMGVYFRVMSETHAKFLFGMGLSYIVEIWCVKAAFLCFYWNLYSRTPENRRYPLRAASFLIPATFLACLTGYLAHCQPVSMNWDLEMARKTGKTCSPNTARSIQFLVGFSNISTDLMLLALPLSILHSLRLTRVDSFAVTFVFLIGILSISATITRVTVLSVTGALTNGNVISLQQLHWLEVLSTFEILAALTAFCLPSFRFILQAQLFSTLRSWRRGDKSSGSAEDQGRVVETIGGGGRKPIAGGRELDTSMLESYDEVEMPGYKVAVEDAADRNSFTLSKGPSERCSSQERLRTRDLV